MKKRGILFTLTAAVLLSGCYYDVEEELYGLPAPCVTGDVTYSGTVTGLLTSYGCLGCHSGTGASGNVNLQGHANIMTVVSNGRLLGAISHSPGFSPMPKDGAKMKDCDISKIKAWIDAGAPNN